MVTSHSDQSHYLYYCQTRKSESPWFWFLFELFQSLLHDYLNWSFGFRDLSCLRLTFFAFRRPFKRLTHCRERICCSRGSRLIIKISKIVNIIPMLALLQNEGDGLCTSAISVVFTTSLSLFVLSESQWPSAVRSPFWDFQQLAVKLSPKGGGHSSFQWLLILPLLKWPSCRHALQPIASYSCLIVLIATARWCLWCGQIKLTRLSLNSGVSPIWLHLMGCNGITVSKECPLGLP